MAFAVLAVVHGARSGLVVQALSLLGGLLGLVVGAHLAARFTSTMSDPEGKAFLALFCVVGSAALVSGVGHLVGVYAARLLWKTPLRTVDLALGAALAVVVTLAGAWLFGNMVANNPSRPVAAQVQQSTILRFLDEHLPAAPAFVARVQRLLDVGGLPQVFAQFEPPPAQRLPLPAVVSRASARASASTVKIEGEACNLIQEGSGFVFAPGEVITNAHVVAGVRAPQIVAPNGTTTRATVVLFDPNLDLAVLRDTSLNAPALTLSASPAPRGTAAVVVGYPGGGPLDTEPAVILAETSAIGRNIYDTSTTARSVYEVEANVRSGNSGGPLVAADGTVIGVVFARSTSYNEIGYALTSPAVRNEAFSAASRTQATSTGSCTA